MFKLDLLRATLQDVVDALITGQVTSESLVIEYLARIDKDNVEGLGLRAIMSMPPRDKLLRAARKLDAERQSGIIRSPLHGVPILVKESIDTHVNLGMKTTAGIIPLEDSPIYANADLIDNVLAAGLIIIGKANMSHMNAMYSSDIPNGWTPRGGPCISTYGGGYDPSGSSSGCAVGVSAGFAAASIAVETCGSITTPSKRQGLYGYKPSAGLISNRGMLPITNRLDIPGPMGKSVWDLTVMMEVLTGYAYLQYTEAPYNDIARYRIGVPRKHFAADDTSNYGAPYPDHIKREAVEIFDRVVSKVAPVLDPAEIDRIDRLWSAEPTQHAQTSDHKDWGKGPNSQLMMTEYYDHLNEYLARRGNETVKDMESLIKWNEQNPTLAYHDINKAPQDDVLRQCAKLGGRRDEAFYKAEEELAAIAKSIDEMFDANNLDALLIPAGLGAAGTRTISVATAKGYPIAVIPVAILSSDEPYCVYLLGRKNDDGPLLGVIMRAGGRHLARPLQYGLRRQ